MSLLRAFFSGWAWRMAWRDSRRSRKRLLLFSASIVLGIAALAAIGSFGKQLEGAVEDQARTLLGADLVISSRDPFNAEAEALLASIGGIQAREINFSSMVFFPATGGTRLVQVRALDGDFPFYGQIEARPPSAVNTFRSGGEALVEQGLLAQFNAEVGSTVRVGDLNLRVGGALTRVPGETVVFATIAPRVYIAAADVRNSALLGAGSLVRYKVYFKLPPGTDVPARVRELRPELERFRMETDTVERRKRELGRAMTNLYHFLNLVGFIAVLLGGVGIASAIHVHIQQKLGTVAVLRCLGSVSGQAFAIYLIQALALGAAGALAGGLLGLLVLWILPRVVGDLIPVEVSYVVSWSALFRGMGVGLFICLLFALLPLLGIRHVSPMATLRSAVEPARRRDPFVWLAYVVIAASLVIFSISQSSRWTLGLSFGLAMLAAFAILSGVARLLVRLLKGRVPRRLPYVVRQGLANIHRPNNRTVLLLVSVGAGTFLILTLYLAQHNLLSQLFPSGPGGQANAVLFDIQEDQREGVRKILREQNLPVLDEAPIITMRIQSIKGRSLRELRAEDRIPRWTLTREYRSTYRAHLVETETLVAGVLAKTAPEPDEPIPVSLEEGIATNLEVGLGDELVFDVQGVPVRTVVGSLRTVDWRRVQPNFFVIFPPGAIDEAPAFHILVTHVPSSDAAAAMQREVVGRYPNVSSIDLSLVLQTVDEVLSKIAFVIRFMALFTVGTGLLVLAGSVLTGKYQRIQESILLRTLGATRAQIRTILVVEYMALGALAAMTGVALAFAASWALALFVFKVNFSVPLWPAFIALAVVTAVTTLTGLLTSRGIGSHPPLEILRSES